MKLKKVYFSFKMVKTSKIIMLNIIRRILFYNIKLYEIFFFLKVMTFRNNDIRHLYGSTCRIRYNVNDIMKTYNVRYMISIRAIGAY